MNMSMLPTHERVVLQITHVIEWGLGIEFKKQPADVGVEKTFGNVVGILVVIGVFVMPPMFACPQEDGVFEGARAEKKHHQAQRPFRLVALVGEKPVIAGRDAESS